MKSVFNKMEKKEADKESTKKMKDATKKLSKIADETKKKQDKKDN